jgi:hypothetical protein
MKVALCFSGHMRDLNETKNFWTELIKKYDIDVYASFWDIENPELGDTIKEFEKVYTPKRLEVESYDIFKQTTQDFASMHIQSPTNIDLLFQNTTKAFGQLSMYYKVWRANMLSKQLGIEYDIVIRTRIDIVLDENFELQLNNYLNVPMGRVQSYTWSNNFGINDCFAYGRPKIMDYYSFIFLQMMEYLKQGHYAFPPEHFLSVHFSKIKIEIREFPNYMIITRISKGTQHEVYNKFVSPPREEILWSDRTEFLPDPNGSFKKSSIKDDFNV